MTYGSEYWAVKKKDTQKLHTWKNWDVNAEMG